MYPLAVKLRPKTLDGFIGQEHLISKNKMLRKMLETDKLRSIIFFGPPGTGKTTLAKIISESTGSEFYELNATSAGISEIRKLIKRAETYLKDHKRKTIVFIDEIHRWNKSQQDALLPSVESGVIVLIGATTLNPYFSINGPLLSRSEIFEFRKLDKKSIIKIILNAVDYYKGRGKIIKVNKEVVNIITNRTGGDARKTYNLMEIIVETSESDEVIITKELIDEILPNSHVVFDMSGDERYDGMSAIQGSIQFSDPHSAIYWLAWCINRGEDLNIICRRLLVAATEDVGLSDPQCLPYVMNAVQAAQQVGFPEASIILSSAVAYLAAAPRSKASAKAIWKALSLEKQMSKEIPNSLKDCHYSGASTLGRGGTKDGTVPSEYDPIIENLFVPENGFEKDLFKHNDILWGREDENS